MDQPIPIAKLATAQSIQIDIDDYINSLIRENEYLKNTIRSLKSEIKIQRKEIAGLREERKTIIDSDKGPNSVTWIE